MHELPRACELAHFLYNCAHVHEVGDKPDNGVHLWLFPVRSVPDQVIRGEEGGGGGGGAVYCYDM